MGKDLLGYKGAKTVFFLVAVCTLAQSMAILLQAKWLAGAVSALFAGSTPQEQGRPLPCSCLHFWHATGSRLCDKESHSALRRRRARA